MNDQSSEKSVLEQIFDWSENQSLWKRDALRRVFVNDELSETDITELATILWKQKVSGSDDAASVEPLEKRHLPNRSTSANELSLLKISETSNVNRLAADQTLEFNKTGITVVFGNNGSGKSGYTRILKNACTARHRRKILPNIYDSSSTSSNSSAMLSYSSSEEGEVSLKWENSDTPHQVLSAISVFDRECAEVHVEKANEVAFRPLGLDVPEKLVEVFKSVENKLKTSHQSISSSQNAIFHTPCWKEYTSVGKFITQLTAHSKFDDFKKLGEFNPENELRLKDLNELISKDSTKAVAEVSNQINSLVRLIDFMNRLVHHYSKENWQKLDNSIQNFHISKATAQTAADTAFSNSALDGVGTEVWRQLWNSAKKFSVEIAYPDSDFPNTEMDAVCILCHQPVAEETQARLQAFETFVKSDTEEKLRQAENTLASVSNQLRQSRIVIKNVKSDLAVLRVISEEGYFKYCRYLAELRCLQSKFVRKIDTKTTEHIEFTPSAVSVDFLDIQLNRLKTLKEEYEAAGTETGILKLKQERDNLLDQKWASNNLSIIDGEIKRLRNLYYLEECLKDTKTNSLTTLGNKLADEAITAQLRDNFLDEISNLVRNKFRVEIVRSGGRAGSPKYKVRLVRSPTQSVPEILSEGEQTCVAIASFFSELSTSEHNATLVFDDPISSLDHRWRLRVAKRLVKEAETRQVIVFTHDLIFLNDLEDGAKKTGIAFTARHIKATPEVTGLVDDNLPWDGMKIKARIDALEKLARKIRSERTSLDDEAYKMKARDFYSVLRASWERALEEVALVDTVIRFRDYISANNIKKIAALTTDMCQTWSENFHICCDYTDSHDTSRARAQELPEPEELLEDVNKLKIWVNLVRDEQKIIS